MEIHSLTAPAALLLASLGAAQSTTIYSTDFSTLDGWVPTAASVNGVAWAADATPAAHPTNGYLSPPASLNFNDGTNIGGNTRSYGCVTSPPIELSVVNEDARLRFSAFWDSQTGCIWDQLWISIRSTTSGQTFFEQCLNSEAPMAWHAFDLPLQSSWGSVEIRFCFDTIDEFINDGMGAFIDDLEIVDVPVVYTTFCSGDGSGTICPCGNPGVTGAGCANSTGVGARLVASGSASFAAGNLVLAASHLCPNQFGTFVQGNNRVNGGSGTVLGDGLRCAGGSLVRLQNVLSDAAGTSFTSIAITARGGVAPGDTRTYQLRYRDPVNSPCSTTFNLTNGIEVTWAP